MAFSSLFTGLSAMKEDVKEPGQPLQPLPAHRKRQRQGEHSGPRNKKQRNQNQFTSLFKAPPDGGKAAHSNVQRTDGLHHHNDKVAHDLHFKGQNYKPVNIQNSNKQQEWKERKQGQTNRQRGRGRPVFRGGRQQGRPASMKDRGKWKNTNDAKDFQVKRTQFMTPEFMEQNVLSVDGRLVCKHFIWGRCFKGDECQLEHIQCCNDLLKEVCKFYIQGFCTKGESCPYMHQSFPCKYFHTRGRCFKEANCMFSHEPLNDLTKQLLDKFLIREQEMVELAKKVEQKSSGQPGSTDEPEATEADKQPDILDLPLRPNFYKSSDTQAEGTEELSDNKLEEVASSESDAAQLCSAPSVSPPRQEPVCYSVEAVLGTQLSKPFANYFTTSRSQESDTLSSPGSTSGSCQSVENSTLNPPPAFPVAQSASYVPLSQSYQLLNSGIQNQKVSASVNLVSRSQESSLKLTSSLVSQICPSLISASGDQKEQGGTMPESLQTAPRASHEIPLHIPRDTSSVLNSKRGSFTSPGLANHRNIFSRPPGETFTSKHLPVLIPASKASWKPVGPSSGATEARDKVTVTVDPVSIPTMSSAPANSFCHAFNTKQPTDIREKLSASEGDAKQHFSSDAVDESSTKMAHCGESSVVCKKPPEIPFRSLFAAPIADTPQPLGSSVTCSSSVSQSADSRRNPPNTAPDKAPTRSFLSLFSAPLTAAPLTAAPLTAAPLTAAPLTAAPLPPLQPEPDNTSTASCSDQPAEKETDFSDSKRKPDSETALPPQATSDILQIPHEPEPNFPPNPVVKPVAIEQQPPERPSHKAATANSVLKTLFLHLSPFREDKEISGASGEQMPHQEKKQKGKKKPKDHNLHKVPTRKAAPSSPGIEGPQVNDCGSHNLPFQAGLKLTSEEGQRVNGSAAGSSLKDLFKNLDTSISPFQH